MLIALLTAAFLASAGQAAAEEPPTAAGAAVYVPTMGEEPAPAEEAAPAEEPVEAAEAEEPEEETVCRRRTVQDDFGRQKSIKVCRPKSQWSRRNR